MGDVVKLTKPLDIGHRLVRRGNEIIVVETVGEDSMEFTVSSVEAGKAVIEHRRAMIMAMFAAISPEAAVAVVNAKVIRNEDFTA